MFLYRLGLSLIAPLVLLRLWWRVRRGHEASRSLRERLGGGTGHAPATARVLWLHGASNGEIASARWMIKQALARDRDLRVLVTANTETGRDLAEGWMYDRLQAAMAPLDHRLALWLFFRRWHPCALVVLESELWPNRFDMCRARQIPVLIFGARMSERAARRWRLLPRLRRALFAAIHWLSAQDDPSADRFRALGLADARIGPVVNLKAVEALNAADATLPEDLADFGARHLTFLAASTHQGEDAALIEGFAAARSRVPALRMILAPRHPRRSRDIARLIGAAGLPFAVRSKGEAPGADTVVYLADTMGEMDLWYRLAGITFVGGSLVDKGGHTPFEPAAAKSAILHGPHVANFRGVYAALNDTFAALKVDSAEALALALQELADPDAQARMTEAATLALIDAVGPGRAEALFAELAKAAELPLLKRPAG